MKLLAIETSTEACSAALVTGTEVNERYRVAPREHTHLILPMIEALLAEAELAVAALDAIGVANGPGAFTSLRIAAGVAQGIAFGADLPVVPVSTLATLAQGAYRESGARRILPAMDARMHEVYWGAYMADEQGVTLQGSERVCPPGEVPDPGEGPWLGYGTGWASYGEALSERLGDRLDRFLAPRYPQARDVATLAVAAYERGERLAPEALGPVYLRDQVVRRPAG